MNDKPVLDEVVLRHENTKLRKKLEKIVFSNTSLLANTSDHTVILTVRCQGDDPDNEYHNLSHLC